jgi:hypothetical protein
MGKMRRIWLVAMAAVLVAGCAAKSELAAPKSAEAPDPAATPAAPAEPSAAEPGGDSDGAPEMSAPGYGQAQPGFQPPPSPPPAPAAQGAAQTTTPAKPSANRASRPSEAKKEDRTAAADPAARPGLGTEWGETRTSRISNVTFLRADAATPFTTAALFYNDEQGARAMAGVAGFQRTPAQAFPMAGGAVAIGLRSESGRFLSGFTAGERRFVVGEAGIRYSIVLRNLTPNRFECVVSVDGLDVLDGKAASFSKRGYILDPHGELEIDGFRQSMEEVAAFRFGSVRGSYANQKHGDARNVGVIGVALFHERGTAPWTPDEVNRRNQANPFPGQFAKPPGTP